MGGYYQRQDDMEGVGMTDMQSTPEPSVAASILREAATIVDGARQQTHGDRERSFQDAANGWFWWLNMRHAKDPRPIDAVDVAVMQALMKLTRAANGDMKHTDHWTDASAYLALAGELAGVWE